MSSTKMYAGISSNMGFSAGRPRSMCTEICRVQTGMQSSNFVYARDHLVACLRDGNRIGYSSGSTSASRIRSGSGFFVGVSWLYNVNFGMGSELQLDPGNQALLGTFWCMYKIVINIVGQLDIQIHGYLTPTFFPWLPFPSLYTKSSR